MAASGTPVPPVDTLLLLETPEGIDLPLRPAGLVPRALAYAADLLLRGAVLAALAVWLLPYGRTGMGALLLVGLLANWGYMVLFEVLYQGRTPGKRLLGLKVVMDDGTPVGWAGAAVRNLLRTADLLPFGYAAGLLCCLWHPHFKRLGDLAAGTLVVHQPTAPELLALPAAIAEPAPFVLSINEQRALVALAQRQATFSPARAEELAGLLAAPLGVAPPAALPRINAIARALAGHP